MPKFKDLTGQRFGRLVVLGYAGSKGRHSAFLCKCDCGNGKIINGDSLRRGVSKSCGCLHREQVSKLMLTHGLTKHYRRICSALRNMISRCDNPKNKFYKDYGGRGITVCNEWRESVKSFVSWSLANGYEENLTIDRIDNDEDYSPENCRWITPKEQNRNMRSNIVLSIDGETKILKDWAETWGLNYQTVGRRYRHGDRGEMLSRPVRGMSKNEQNLSRGKAS